MKKEILNAIHFYLENESDAVFKSEVEKLLAEKKEDELYDRFYRTLEFGTAGLRGIIGGGTNRMNTLVVRRASQGMANYLKKAFPKEAKTEAALRIAIAYDCRNYSAEFAKAAALIFVANGFTAYLFSDLRPTPELSYAIRELKCHSGIVVTASHNPKEYNGYKAYWSDGAQITPPHDLGIINEVNAVNTVKSISEEEALKSGRLKMIDSEIDEKFWTLAKSKVQRRDLIQKMAKEVKIVYTPLHGTGGLHVIKVLGDLGFTIIPVPEQIKPDGNFPTASYPNPEDPAAMKMGMDLAQKEAADLLMASDPDADRFACAVKNSDGKMQIISGNQMGALFADYLALTAKELNKNIKNPVMIRSIVSSRLIDRIAETYGVKVYECLTGFKWICGLVEEIQKAGKETYMFAFEESYGYNFGAEIRDKDAITAAAICAEMAIYWKSKNKSLFDRLDELFVEHGVHIETTISKTFKGASGVKIMQDMMQSLRAAKLKKIASFNVEKIRDIQAQSEYNPAFPEGIKKIDLPKSNVLQYFLEGGNILCVRPSGTEPKIKTYIMCRQALSSGSLAEAKTKAGKNVEELKKAMDTLFS